MQEKDPERLVTSTALVLVIFLFYQVEVLLILGW